MTQIFGRVWSRVRRFVAARALRSAPDAGLREVRAGRPDQEPAGAEAPLPRSGALTRREVIARRRRRLPSRRSGR